MTKESRSELRNHYRSAHARDNAFISVGGLRALLDTADERDRLRQDLRTAVHLLRLCRYERPDENQDIADYLALRAEEAPSDG